MSTALYHEYSCTETFDQEVAQVIVGKVSAALSIGGSTFILAFVWGKWRMKKSSIDSHQRIMVMYSIYDILFSFFMYFLGTWMVPAETGWWGAVGNKTTCSVQGFFQNSGLIGCALYQIALSLQVLLLVTYSWSSSKFQRLLEHRIHFTIVVITIGFGLVPLFFQGYNPGCGMCNAYPTPVWCENSVHPFSPSGGDKTTECVRGSATLGNVYLSVKVWAIIIATVFCTGAMIAVYTSVYRQEKKMAKYSFSSENKEHHAESKRIRKTMLLYTGSFYLCWMLPSILRSTRIGINLIVAEMLFPLMGFFNMLCFIQPKCLKYQRQHPGTNLLTCYFFVIFHRQIELVKRFKRGDTDTMANSTDPVDVDDGIGFETYNECVSSDGNLGGPLAVDESVGAPTFGLEESVSRGGLDRDIKTDASRTTQEESPAIP